MPWEQTEDSIRSGHRDPGDFDKDSLRTITIDEEQGIKAVIGCPSSQFKAGKCQVGTEVQSFIFAKDKDWTLAKAKAWFKAREAKAKESFSWVGDIKPVPGVTNLIRGKALHPIKTYHYEEWPEVREYLEEELEKSAHTLTGKPLLLDHYQVLRGKVLGAEYEEGAIEYVAQLNDPGVMELIRNGAIEHVSVEFEWQSLKNVNGVAPLGINFTGLSLLRLFEPGDPQTTVELFESIIKRLKEAKNVHHGGHQGMSTVKEQAEPQEFILYVLHDPMAFLQEHFSTVWIDQTNGMQGIFGRLREDPENSVPQALLFMKANNWDLAKMQDWLQNHPQYLRASAPAKPGIQPAGGVTGVLKMNEEELKKLVETQVKAILKEQQNQEPEPEKDEHGCTIGKQRWDPESETCVPIPPQQQAQEAEAWSAEWINDLPDGAFAVIAAGGEKDDQGKTVPRTLRKLPHHNMQGNLDLPHLRNALARVNQIEGGDKAKAKKHLCGHARGEKAEDLVSKFCGEEPPATEQHGEEEPEKDEHGCVIGKERYDEEQDKCVPITAEARIAFLETSLKLKEEELTEEEIKQKIADLMAQRDALYKQREEIGEEERAEIQKQLDVLYAEIQAYEQALATKIAGQAAPPEVTPVREEKKKGLGEAIIDPGTASEPTDLISRKEVLALIPDRRVWRSWSYGPQMLVRQLKRKLEG